MLVPVSARVAKPSAQAVADIVVVVVGTVAAAARTSAAVVVAAVGRVK